MGTFENSLTVSASGMEAQAMRLRYISENLANADTPGYRRKTAPFETELDGGRATGRVELGQVELDRSDLTRVFDPGSPLADQNGYYDGSNVDMVIELADAREAQRSYEANLKLFDQARQMSQSLLELLRR
ncbi:flagellar basal body rod protein FlgC [Frigidibacter sp. RF13]|uniref:flagellar basal body rod protein FlgC n=1 Tax=Frigidibacter sp. RF13 TaxID=2997340 RepID=UPI00226E7D67|nr:flagellar basal body rod protein FlgC [Frigidibacter sp. RF13]MCY1128703.1 flagellar basal body rod protein FlgC [Frigidibacter sp. RF13]